MPYDPTALNWREKDILKRMARGQRLTYGLHGPEFVLSSDGTRLLLGQCDVFHLVSEGLLTLRSERSEHQLTSKGAREAERHL